MKTVRIYTTPICPYCVRAKALFDKKGASYTEINVSTDDGLRQYMTNRAGGRRSVPQIFINGTHIGGCDDIMALEQAGKLDALLA